MNPVCDMTLFGGEGYQIPQDALFDPVGKM
jgi:hypothetical protein